MRRFVVIGLVVACLSLLFFTIGETAIEDNLVLHLPFDEGQGNAVKDKSGKGNNGVVRRANWVEGKSGKALEFNGKDSFVEIQDSDSLNPTTGTFAAWIKPGKQAPTQWGSNGIVDKWEQAGDFKGYLIQSGASAAEGPKKGFERIGFLIGAGGDYKIIPVLDLSVDTWSHIAMTWDGKIMAVYINGKGVGEEKVKMVPAIGPMFIGKRAHGANGFFTGIVDEVAVFNKELSPAEIQRIMRSVLAVSSSGKVAVTWGIMKDWLVR